jgi:hypothetical protein
MPTLVDLEDYEVQVVNLTLQQARHLCGATAEFIGNDTLDNALDNAQGEVFSGNKQKQYVVIVVEGNE